MEQVLFSVPLKKLEPIIKNWVRDVLKESIPQQSENKGDQLLTVDEAAEFLSLTKPTIYSKVSRGELPVMKRTKRLYFSREDLTEYIRAGRKKTNVEINADAETYLRRR